MPHSVISQQTHTCASYFVIFLCNVPENTSPLSLQRIINVALKSKTLALHVDWTLGKHIMLYGMVDIEI